MTDQILECLGGHTWSRPSQRGRPPKVCEIWPACEIAKEGRQEPAQTTVDQMIALSEAEGDDRKSEIITEAGEVSSADDFDRILDGEEPINPFIAKAKAQAAAPIRKRPTPKPEVKSQISDQQEYNDAAVPGVKISNLNRDEDGVWRCVLKINEESFDCIRKGGWHIIIPDNFDRAMLPIVAAAVQDRVRRLERAEDSEKPEPVTEIAATGAAAA